ncbi:DUF4279 domain-containing protein [Pseudomonas sp. NPDC090201]|uniref:DUF4279 domain-containing protein n=1 Tax=Pseudomonas sp. NPDC090201 TaxID=3364475 RepID=UPI00381A9736
MPALDRGVAALRIFGEHLDPEELNCLFGRSYTDGWVKGEEFSTSSGAVVTKKTGGWVLEAEPVENADFDGQILRLLGSIDASLDVWALVASRFEMDIFCGWFMRESIERVTISPQIMRMLSDRGITLYVDIYAP